MQGADIFPGTSVSRSLVVYGIPLSSLTQKTRYPILPLPKKSRPLYQMPCPLRHGTPSDGMVRRKNVLSTLMMSFAVLGLHHTASVLLAFHRCAVAVDSSLLATIAATFHRAGIYETVWWQGWGLMFLWGFGWLFGFQSEQCHLWGIHKILQ